MSKTSQMRRLACASVIAASEHLDKAKEKLASAINSACPIGSRVYKSWGKGYLRLTVVEKASGFSPTLIGESDSGKRHTITAYDVIHGG